MAAALAACSVPPVPTLKGVPIALRSCPRGGGTPVAPAAPRTLESLVAGYNRVQQAREISEAARVTCAAKLHELNVLYNAR